MNNKIRKLLLVLVAGLVVAFGVSFYSKAKIFTIPTAIKLGAKGIDIEIENFNVSHEVLGNKQWELKAKMAQIDNDRNRITLSDVAVTLNLDADHTSQISADAGVMNSETKEIELEGHVRFVADADQFFNRFQSPATSPQNNQEPVGE